MKIVITFTDKLQFFIFMYKYWLYKLFIFYFFTLMVCYAQTDKPIGKKLVNITSLDGLNQTFVVPPFTILHLDFELKNDSFKKNKQFIDIGREELGILYENKNNQKVKLGQAGARVPLPERSVKSDLRVIEIELKADENKKLTLTIENFLPTQKLIKTRLMSESEYQSIITARKDNFYQKYLSSGYLAVLILILLLTIIQYFVLPERVFIYYFLYIFFTFIRSAAHTEAIVLEVLIPFFNRIHYSSMNSQVFVYLSFIFYVLFLREFTNFPSKNPRLDYFFKVQLVYLFVFVIFDLIYPSEKFSNFQINAIFRALETFGLVLGLLNLVLLFKVYDEFNKYIIIGAVSLYIVGILGQEIIKRTFDANQNPETYSNYLAIVWLCAYLVEIMFFTIALVSRQKILLKSIQFEKKQNKLLTEQLATTKTLSQQDPPLDYDSFSLATNRGVLVFQQADIVRLEASGNYTIFSIQNHKQTLASYTLAEFEPKLNPSKFIRVHKSHVINLQYVVKYTKGDGGTLTLQDGSEIPVSRSRKEEVLKRLHTA
jgi:hypothetical protein